MPALRRFFEPDADTDHAWEPSPATQGSFRGPDRHLQAADAVRRTGFEDHTLFEVTQGA